VTEPGVAVKQNAPGRGIRTFDSFRIHAYRMYFLGMIGQWASFSMEAVARSYLIYEITGSAALLGLMSLASAIPMILLSLFGGAVADRFPKKRLIQMSQVAMSAVSLGNAIAISTGYLSPQHPESVWVLMVGAIIMGIIMALAMPSRQSIVPELVRRDQIMNAVSLNTLGMSVFQLVGPALAGYIVAAWGYAAVFFCMTGLNALAILATSFLPTTKPAPGRRKNVLVDVGQGLKYIASHKTILSILLLFVASVLLAMPYQMLMPVFAKDILKVGIQGQGTLMSVSGIGALAASLTLASLPSRKKGLVLIVSNAVMGIALVVFAFSVSWPLSLATMVFVGMGRIGNNTSGATILQMQTEPEYLGRVMSVMMMNFGLSGLGTFFAGVMAQSISAQWSIGMLAAALVAISIASFLFMPRLRKLE
jgi:MFS transporter, DHA1 family, staphyloferrin A biosynthesis exporter